MKNYILACIFLLGLSVNVFAQDKIVVTGVVTDTNNEPMIGVSVMIPNMPGLGTITDINGKYSIKVAPYHKLAFTFIGYDSIEVLIKEQKTVNIVMKESEANALDEVVVTGTGSQKKIAISGAITNVDLSELKHSPSTSIADGLAGVVPGIQAMQTSGRPGSVSEFWIRSISTFGANSAALVLVDGFERDLNEVNVEDVASFTVLKDASATAIYGTKGANGVILINTRRGKEGKINIDAKVEGFYNTFTQVPDFVDGYTYASMANEAKVAHNEAPVYQPEELEIFRLGLDPDLYPNVDWMDKMLRNGAWSSRASLNMTGGGRTARYYVGGSYQEQQGMYKTDKALKEYNTNANYRKWTYRMNVDIDITNSTLLKVGVSGSLRKQNDPGVGTDAIWTTLMGYNAIMLPVLYSDGKVPAWSGQADNINPWTQATQTGYKESWQNNIQTNVVLEQDLNFITKGLKFIGRFGYDTNNSNYINRVKWPELFRAARYRDTSTGELILERVSEEKKMAQTSGSEGDRREYLEWELYYDRSFHKNNFGGVVKYTQSSKVFTQNIGEDLKNGIARRNQGIAGRVNYNWSYRYFVDFNFGYTGSENFSKGNRFGFFPAASCAWNISEEPFIKKNFKWMDMLKIRFSYGKTGNDNLGDIRFPYLYTIAQDGNGYQFADINYDRTYAGMRYTGLASTNVGWEIATKKDLGIDFSFFYDKVSGSLDYYEEKREGIYMTRNFLPWIAGLESDPSANVGIVKASGFDGSIKIKHKIKKVDFTFRGNITYGKNKIIDSDEENSVYYYKMKEGHRVNQAMGLIALGLFKDYEEIRNWPKQEFKYDNKSSDPKYGRVYDVSPGDIKYKDVNGDGVINDDDMVAIGATTRPNLTYGFGVSASYSGLDINVHFQGVGKSTYFIDGSTVHMFRGGDGWGNILTKMANGNRWIEGVNEDPNADYPRLSYGENPNNERKSSYWLRDGSYLRLKTLDVGYSLPKKLINKVHFNKVRIYFIGTNLLTFTKFKLWDPEMASADGKAYPLSRTYSMGIQVNL